MCETFNKIKRKLKKQLKKWKQEVRSAKVEDRVERDIERREALMSCAGDLEASLTELKRMVKTQSDNINQGEQNGNNTLVQRQILWDAAIGYMLVRDAIYALHTVPSMDSVSHAYELLDAATNQIFRRGKLGVRLKKWQCKIAKGTYEYVASFEAMEEKNEQLESFFERLIVEGDIEQCLLDLAKAAAVEQPTQHTQPTQPTTEELNNLTEEEKEVRRRLENAPADQSVSGNNNDVGGSQSLLEGFYGIDS